MSPASNDKQEETTLNMAVESGTDNVTKDATNDATTGTVPDTSSKPQDEENYLDDTPHSSQKDAKKPPAKKSPAKKSPTKAAAKPEAAANTGEKRQRSIAEMFGAKGGGAAKKARASTPPPGDRAGMASSSPGGDPDSAPQGSKTPARRTVNGIVAFKYIPFSMDEFQKSLTDDQKRLLQLECETLNKSWLKVLKDELTKPYFIKLKQFLWDEGVRDANTPCPKIYPPAKDIYTWSRCTPLGRVKVVIIGQDPYHGPKQAHGLCFSVRPGVNVPPSLRNMYTEIKSTYPSFVPPKHGYLTSWANQGVLMLNTSLTVRAGQAGSHAGKGWEDFTDAVVKAVDKYGGASLPGGNGVGRGVVFFGLGKLGRETSRGVGQEKTLYLDQRSPLSL